MFYIVKWVGVSRDGQESLTGGVFNFGTIVPKTGRRLGVPNRGCFYIEGVGLLDAFFICFCSVFDLLFL